MATIAQLQEPLAHNPKFEGSNQATDGTGKYIKKCPMDDSSNTIVGTIGSYSKVGGFK
jgi:hypothetical protein